MTDPIDTARAPMTSLRTVVLTGPPARDGGAPLWTLVAAAPRFGRRHAHDAAGHPTGVTADHVHTVRVLAADPPDPLTRWRRPRLLDLQLVIGAVDTTGDEDDYESTGDRLTLRLPGGLTIDGEGRSGEAFRALSDGPVLSKPDEAARQAEEAPFVRVVGEPLGGAARWPGNDIPGDQIAMPPVRLVAGRVGLAVRLATPNGKPTAFSALAAWGAVVEARPSSLCTLWLTPDGIEFDAALPFPSTSLPNLRARVLLSTVDGAPGLTWMRPATSADEAGWRDAWRRIAPAADAALLGLRFGAATSQVPAFRWPVDAQGRPSATVRIPAEAFRIELVSPEVRGAIDGVATIHPRWVDAESDGAGGIGLRVQSGDLSPATEGLTLKHFPDTIDVDAGNATFLCPIDDARLARELRDAYGFETPPPLPVGLSPSTSAGAGFDRPLLAAFVPLSDGWLQWPVPNLGPIDPHDDPAMRVASEPNDFGAGAFTGYLRLRDPAGGAQTRSAHAPPPTPSSSAPWQVTIERAAGIDLCVKLNAGTPRTPATLREARAVLHGVRLSTRGLLWVSTDRPDALEALPRAGAGPGAFLDIPLEGRIDGAATSRSVLSSRLTGLHLSGDRRGMRLERVETTLDFDAGAERWANELLRPAEATRALAAARRVVDDGATNLHDPWPAVAWRRHAVVPLVAQMPMTRVAAGGVRPLESRDLIPFVVALTGRADERMTLATVARSSADAYPVLLDEPGPVIAGWPTDDGRDVAPVRGVAFAALGLPGVEILPGATPATDRAAVRFDLPLLDEAFASAGLPPAPPVPGADEPRREPPQSPGTALDWVALAAFWADQERKLQNARVSDSYLAGFRSVGVAVQTTVKSLIRGVDWTIALGVETAVSSDAVPYGRLTLDREVSGNAALLGHDGTLAGATVIGFSPSTFDHFGRQLDNRRVGAGTPIVAGELIARSVSYPGATLDTRLATLAKPLEVTIAHGGHSLSLAFWFKDLLVVGNRAELPEDMDFDVWNGDANLLRGGREWRLAPVAPLAAGVTLAVGRSEIPFFGFRLEPLSLERVVFDGNAVQSADLLCRLALGPSSPTSDDGANQVCMRLVRNGAGLVADLTLPEAAPALVYTLAAGPERRTIALTAGLAGTGFALQDVRLSFAIAGRPVSLPATLVSRIDQKTEQVRATFERKPGPIPFAASIVVDRAELAVGYTLASTASGTFSLVDLGPSFELRTTVAVCPPPRANEAVPAAWFTCSRVAGTLTTLMLGTRFESPGAAFVEGAGAIQITVDPCETDFALLPVHSSYGFVARLAESSQDGVIELLAGALVGGMVQREDKTLTAARATVRAGRISIEVARRRRGEPDSDHWRGTVGVDGVCEATSALQWPALEWADADLGIPVPRRGNGVNSGRATVFGGASKPSAVHDVRWTFSGHRLPIETAAALARNDATTFWSTPVQATHALARGTTRLTWSSVETVALGSRDALVPRLDPKNVDADDLTFAARYAYPVDTGAYGPNPDPSMRRPGLGRIATVLQGALGRAFREALGAAGHDGLLLCGGFLGAVQTTPGAEAALLLRLPVLVGPLPLIAQTDIPSAGLELAWADGPAARWLALTRPGAASPGNASLDALTAALRAGSRAAPGNPGAGDATDDDPVGALLVEQSFPNPAKPIAQPALETSPFFLASAVGVEKVLATVEGRTVDSDSLSLVAGAIHRRLPGGGSASIPLAGAIASRGSAGASALATAGGTPLRTPELARLWLLGDDLTVDDWNGPDPGADRLPPGSTVTRLAEARHAIPRAALLCLPSPNGPPRYLAVPTVGDRLPALAGVVTTAGGGQVDGGRGFSCMPETAPGDDVVRWLAAPLEGPTLPVRDALPASRATGLAGLTRRIALPRHAGPSVGLDDLAAIAPALPAVWISQTQVPAYLDVGIEGLEGPPLAWLVPAPPHVRLPWASEVRETLRAASPPAPQRRVQPFLPDLVDATALGERAGILTVRRTRLLAELGPVRAFDASQARFGRMAQAGSSLARTLRTPRPGPLPPNTGQPGHDRRIQADFLHPLTAARACIGSADSLCGERLIVGQPMPWVVTVIAAPEWESTVTDAWDGSVELLCRVEIDTGGLGGVAPSTPARLLASLLQGADGEAPVPQACLMIGDETLAYRSLSLVDAGAFDDAAPAVSGPQVRTGVVRMVLDFLPATGSGHPPHPAVVAALSRPGPLPRIELQWTLYPGERQRFADEPATGARWNAEDPPAWPLPQGESDAPVTLRLPLYPITEARGALPLTPASVLFCDPAYDRDLASEPFVDSGRVGVTPVGAPGLPPGRGELMLRLVADRRQAHRLGTITFLLDAAFERRLDDAAQAQAEAAENGVLPGGDLLRTPHPAIATLRLTLLRSGDPDRELRCDRTEPSFVPGRVCELPLARLSGADGRAAALRGGDALVLEVALRQGAELRVWCADDAKFPNSSATLQTDAAVTRRLRIMLTDTPVADPPPAFYAAMLRTDDGNVRRIVVPVCAQSPLPARVDLIDAARGMRRGMVHRRAMFVWTLMRPRAELTANAISVVKGDRNGQIYLPEIETEFIGM